jgi:hypothetical protein
MAPASVEVAWNTPLSKLEELEKKMNHWLETDEKRMFEPSTACVIQSERMTGAGHAMSYTDPAPS